jgi:hypothetical protein
MTLPDAPAAFTAPPNPLPESLQAAVDESVTRFESKFGMLSSWAKSQGWIEEYRAEVTRLVHLTLESLK